MTAPGLGSIYRVGLAALALLLIGNACGASSAAVDQSFGNEKPVEILGYSDHAMEPFLSPDTQTLFFNSLNDAVNTSLFYAKRITDTRFQFMGEVKGANRPAPHLDAVASMDVSNQFFFVSTRDYPRDYRNLQTGQYHKGRLTGVRPVEGDFYIRKPGWIIMDAEINPAGSALFYVNARFKNGKPLPDEADLGVAIKTGTAFKKDPNSDLLLGNINTAKHLEYAPAFSLNGLELYFTRLDMSGDTQIMVSRRASLNVPFPTPVRMPIPGKAVEAPALSVDGKLIYYHKRLEGKYRIFRMVRR